ncbi:MAG: hypothetical protein ACQEP9_09495 [Bacillota bacterium]
MKKVITLILALVMVLGVSAVTMAGNDLGDSQDVNVEVKVDEYAELDVDSAKLDLGNIDPENNEATGTIGYTLKANTSVTVTSDVESDLSEKEQLDLETGEDDSYTYDEFENGINTSDDIGVTATLAKDTDDENEGAWERIKAGKYTGTVTVTVAGQ